MPIYEIIQPVIGFILGLLSKSLYDRYRAPKLMYLIDFPHYQIDGGLLLPIKVFNPKEKTINDIEIHIEFNSPIQNVEVNSSLGGISSTWENITMTSDIKRLNGGSSVVYFVRLVDIEKDPFKRISITSAEVKGKEYSSNLYDKSDLFVFIILSIIIGIVLVLLVFSINPNLCKTI